MILQYPAPRPCPACDAAGTLRAGGAETAPGDLLLCLGCGAVTVLLPTGHLRALTLDDVGDYGLADLVALAQLVQEFQHHWERRMPA